MTIIGKSSGKDGKFAASSAAIMAEVV